MNEHGKELSAFGSVNDSLSGAIGCFVLDLHMTSCRLLVSKRWPNHYNYREKKKFLNHLFNHFLNVISLQVPNNQFGKVSIKNISIDVLMYVEIGPLTYKQTITVYFCFYSPINRLLCYTTHHYDNHSSNYI